VFFDQQKGVLAIMKRIVFTSALSLLFFVVAAITATAQDFKKTYKLSAGDKISIRTVSGKITLTGYDGDSIIVTAYKTGRDRDKLVVEDLSSENKIALHSRYPENAMTEAGIDFQVKVPRKINYNFDEIWTASSDIQVSDVTGLVRVDTASGTVRIKNVNGAIKAHNASGDIEVDVASLNRTKTVELFSAGGSITVNVPAKLDAYVEMSSNHGSVQSDFPLEFHDKPGQQQLPKSSARGQIGSGLCRLSISTNTGKVSLKRLN
jgi:hypothetical protein